MSGIWSSKRARTRISANLKMNKNNFLLRCVSARDISQPPLNSEDAYRLCASGLPSSLCLISHLPVVVVVVVVVGATQSFLCTLQWAIWQAALQYLACLQREQCSTLVSTVLH